MKESLIQNLHNPQLMELTSELFENIQLTYDIKEADTKLIAFFVKVVKENYNYLNYDQLNDAFERNSLGLLDNYFNRVGQRPDNKVRSFNIPDLTKIINAYCKYKSIEKEETTDSIVISEEQKAESNTWWCNFIQGCFDKYKDSKERTKIDCSMFAAKKFLRDLVQPDAHPKFIASQRQRIGPCAPLVVVGLLRRLLKHHQISVSGNARVDREWGSPAGLDHQQIESRSFLSGH